jgi:hypothetical protein
MKYANDPRQITAKFNCKCAETGKLIRKDEPCVYYPTAKKVYHPDSKQAYEFRMWQMDIECLGANY